MLCSAADYLKRLAGNVVPDKLFGSFIAISKESDGFERFQRINRETQKDEKISKTYSKTITSDEPVFGRYDTLPPEILENIFKRLEHSDVQNCSAVCKSWYMFVDQHRAYLKKKFTEAVIVMHSGECIRQIDIVEPGRFHITPKKKAIPNDLRKIGENYSMRYLKINFNALPKSHGKVTEMMLDKQQARTIHLSIKSAVLDNKDKFKLVLNKLKENKHVTEVIIEMAVNCCVRETYENFEREHKIKKIRLCLRK